jgi:uncharacterized membrane protein
MFAPVAKSRTKAMSLEIVNVFVVVLYVQAQTGVASAASSAATIATASRAPVA